MAPSKKNNGSPVTRSRLAADAAVKHAVVPPVVAAPVGPVGPETDLLAIVQKCVHTAINSTPFLQEIANALADSVTKAVLAQLEATLNFSVEEVNSLKTQLEGKNKEIASLRDELNTASDRLEQYQRRNSVRIFGLNEVKGEDTDAVALSLFREKLGLQHVKLEDIDRSHRVGRFSSSKPRPIIVKFCSYRTRAEVMRNKKMLKGQAISIREDLTQFRRGLLQAATAKFGKNCVWTADGCITVKLKDGNKKRINSYSELSSLCTQ